MIKQHIKMYGAQWCPDCNRAKAFLKEHHVEYEYHDIEVDESHVRTVETINNGKRIIPTFNILNATYSNPDNQTLANVLGLNSSGQVILYGADWCPDCKRAKSYLDSHGVNYLFISIDQHAWASEEVERLNNGKRIIPTLLINGEQLTNPPNNVLQKVLKLEEVKENKLYDCVIIGAGAAGLTTSIYLQREKFSTVILEKRNIGGNAFITKKIENYPGFTSISGPELMDKMAQQAKIVGAEIKEGYEVKEIKKEGQNFILETNLGQYHGKSIVIATGSTYRRLNIPGEEELIGSGIHFCATCDGPFYRNKHVIVIGGGNSALEEAIYLSEMCEHVDVVHRKKEFSATSTYKTKLASRENMTAHMDKTCLEFLGDEKDQFKGLKVKDNESGEEKIIHADGVFIFIGLVPNTSFVEGTVDLNEKGFITSQPSSVETSLPGTFAAGDVREGAIAQVAAATGEGVIASFGVKENLRNR
ncbi:MAG: FAD-dependent oxidoreductase [Chlamydiota bacterium]